MAKLNTIHQEFEKLNINVHKFDHINVILIIIASIFASVGLLTNNYQSVIASKIIGLALIPYLSFAILLFFFLFYLRKGYEIERIHLAWLIYLFFISVVEEFAFRMMLPIILIDTFGMMSAIIFSNLVFACIHYVTLRWSLINCIIVFIGGLGLSRLLISTEDIAILILVHYFFTFLNTPLPPERRRFHNN